MEMVLHFRVCCSGFIIIIGQYGLLFHILLTPRNELQLSKYRVSGRERDEGEAGGMLHGASFEE